MALFGKIKKIFNKDFLKAVCAGCALVAYADGEITNDEVEKMMVYMGLNEDLKNFSSSEVSKAFNHFVTRIGFDSHVGKLEAFSALEKLVVSSEQAKKVCAVCLAVAKSDGKLEKCEVKVIKEICSKLGVRPSEFGI